jgi:hypothetical protein
MRREAETALAWLLVAVNDPKATFGAKVRGGTANARRSPPRNSGPRLALVNSAKKRNVRLIRVSRISTGARSHSWRTSKPRNRLQP